MNQQWIDSGDLGKASEYFLYVKLRDGKTVLVKVPLNIKYKEKAEILMKLYKSYIFGRNIYEYDRYIENSKEH